MTAQICERLILDGVEMSMESFPGLPKRHPRIVADEEHVRFGDTRSDCWRDYQGTWEIREDRLFLVGLTGKFKLVDPDPLPAEWVTNTLRVRRGEMLEYVHMGLGSVYEEEVHIRIARGVVTGTSVMDNRTRNHESRTLGGQNLPGFENRFEGDGRLVGLAFAWLIGAVLQRLFG